MTKHFDALGDSGRRATATAALRTVQEQLEQLEAMQTMNGAKDDAAAPGGPVAPGAGDDETYAQRREFLQAAEQRLLKRYESVYDALRAVEADDAADQP